MDFGLQACRSDESEWAWEQERRDWRKLAYRGGWIATRDREGPPKNEMRLTAIPGMPPRPEGWAQPSPSNVTSTTRPWGASTPQGTSGSLPPPPSSGSSFPVSDSSTPVSFVAKRSQHGWLECHMLGGCDLSVVLLGILPVRQAVATLAI
ncbi:hypothetical protein JB92DRAFT_2827754 [Gautieria morchelliformis]|nr:hypothetical protein JB92DRAFT_2827754 [Gautieria morchelliformis]